jgi:malonyl-CoA/methylmalonyl-CoA synthetase
MKDYILDFLYAWQVKILADEEHESEGSGTGELCVKSPSLFKEYWKLPEVLSEC